MKKNKIFFILFLAQCVRSEKRPLVIHVKDNSGKIVENAKIFIENKFSGETNKQGDYIIDINAIENKKIKLEISKNDDSGYYAPFYQTITPGNPLEEKFLINAVLYSVPKIHQKYSNEKESSDLNKKTETEEKEVKNEIIEAKEEKEVKNEIIEAKEEKEVKNEIIAAKEEKEVKNEIIAAKELIKFDDKKNINILSESKEKNIHLNVQSFIYSYRWTRALPSLEIICDGIKIGVTNKLGRFSGKISEKTKLCKFFKKDFFEKNIFSPIPENINISFYNGKNFLKPKLALKFNDYISDEEKNKIKSVFFSNESFFQRSLLQDKIDAPSDQWQDTNLNSHLDLVLEIEKNEINKKLTWNLIDNKSQSIFFSEDENKSFNDQYENIVLNFPSEIQISKIISEKEGVISYPKKFPITVGDTFLVKGAIKKNKQLVSGNIGYIKIFKTENNEAYFYFYKKNDNYQMSIGDILEKITKSGMSPFYSQIENLKKDKKYDDMISFYEKIPSGNKFFLKTQYELGDLYLRHKNMPEKSAAIFADLIKKYENPPVSLLVYEAISVFFTAEKLNKNGKSFAKKHYEKSIELFDSIEKKINKNQKDYFSSLENINFHRAMSYQRLWEIENNIIYLRQANKNLEVFINGKIVNLSQYFDQAKKYYFESKEKLSKNKIFKKNIEGNNDSSL